MSRTDLNVFILCGLILLAQSTYLFINARKNGFNHWMWGILGLIQAPVPLILFLIIKKIRNREEDELNDYRDY